MTSPPKQIKVAYANDNASVTSKKEDESLVVIRDMKLKDVSDCYSLGKTLFSFNSSLSRTFDRFVVIGGYSNDPEFCLVAVEDTKMIGFAIGTIITKSVLIGYISWVAVDPEYQRRKIGSMLVNRVEERMRDKGITEFLVDTPVSNLSAIRFLIQLGYGAPVKQVYMSHNFVKQPESIAINNPVPNHPIHHPAPEESSPLVELRVHSTVEPQKPDVNVEIRLMEISDIWPVFQIGESVFTESAMNLYRFWDEAQVTNAYESDGDLALVAEVDGKVVGFALGSTLERIEMKFGYLIWLAVDPSAHGLGIGTLLYNAYESLIKENFEDIDTIIVDTQASNVGAIKFFSRIGFVITDTFIYICKNVGQEDKESSDAVKEVMELIKNENQE